MNGTIDNGILWNEAAKAGAALGAVSVGCLLLKELATLSGSSFLMTGAAVILWVVEFFGCILLMKNLMLRLTQKYEGAKMEDTYRFGRRAALLSGLILASVQVLIILKMPREELATMVNEVTATLPSAQREQLEGFEDKLPLFTFLFGWLYCYLYGSILARILSRYIFMQNLFQGRNFPQNGEDQPDEQ
jgi:cytochrome bd-type quinol oxidase subunit 2